MRSNAAKITYVMPKNRCAARWTGGAELGFPVVRASTATPSAQLIPGRKLFGGKSDGLSQRRDRALDAVVLFPEQLEARIHSRHLMVIPTELIPQRRERIRRLRRIG